MERHALNKKGSARDILLIGVLLFSFAIAILIAYYMVNTTTDYMLNMTEINQSNAATTVLQAGKDLTNRLDYVFFGLFIALTLALIITGYFIGGMPIFMFLYFIVIVISVILSTILSNVWEDIGTLSVLGAAQASAFPITTHVMNQLPIYMAVIGIIGMVVMFAKPYLQQS